VGEHAADEPSAVRNRPAHRMVDATDKTSIYIRLKARLNIMENDKLISSIDTGSIFNSKAVEYDRWYDEDAGKIIFSSEVNAFREILPLLPKPWLEIGVGSGRFAHALGIETGLDPSENMLKIARSRGIITIQGKIEEHILPAEGFGTAFLIMTLCFTANPSIVLREINRILKQGGKIALGEVPCGSTWGTYYKKKKESDNPFYKNAQFYTFSELKHLLKGAGFSIELTLSTLFQKPRDVSKIEIPLNGFQHDAGFVVILARKISDIDSRC